MARHKHAGRRRAAVYIYIKKGIASWLSSLAIARIIAIVTRKEITIVFV